jgi:single-stranded DNA-specific DHH superfamily exonuclease
MKELIRKILKEETLLLESGIRGIKDLARRYKKAKIYYHMDLDGVTTAIAMKNYLEQNGIKVVDAELIQYGAKEFAIKNSKIGKQYINDCINNFCSSCIKSFHFLHL